MKKVLITSAMGVGENEQATIEVGRGMKTLTIVKVGNDARPASDSDIKNVTAAIETALKGQSGVLVTHHAIQIETIMI